MCGNIFANIPRSLREELVETLVRSKTTRVERIVSHGQATPPGLWFDQDRDEFVLLLSGAARLEFAPEGRTIDMAPGDFLVIAAHQRHRVTHTAPHEPSVWLCVHHEGG